MRLSFVSACFVSLLTYYPSAPQATLIELIETTQQYPGCMLAIPATLAGLGTPAITSTEAKAMAGAKLLKVSERQCPNLDQRPAADVARSNLWLEFSQHECWNKIEQGPSVVGLRRCCIPHQIR